MMVATNFERLYRLCDRLTGADFKIKADGEGGGVYIYLEVVVHAHTPVGLDKQCIRQLSVQLRL